MVWHRIARSLGVVLSLGLCVGFTGVLAAAERRADVGTPDMTRFGHLVSFVMVDNGTTKKPHKKNATPKKLVKRKSTKSPHGKTNSAHGKSRVQKRKPRHQLPSGHQTGN